MSRQCTWPEEPITRSFTSDFRRTAMPGRPSQRVGDILLSFMFVGMISLPEIRCQLGSASSSIETEKRELAAMPEWQWRRGSLIAYPGRFEAYYNDHFGFRDQLIHWLNVAKGEWLKTSTAPLVVFGKD